MSDWNFYLLHAGTDEVITELSTARSRSLSFSLNEASSVSFTLSGDERDAERVRELSTDLLCVRDGEPMFRGRIGPSQDRVSVSGHEVAFTAWDYREVFARRLILPGESTMSFEGVEQLDIPWTTIEQSQSRVNGDLGVTRASSTPSGVTRSIDFAAGTSVTEAIQSLSEMENGFEWDITPDMQFRTWYPLRGSNAPALLELGGLVSEVERGVDPSEYANAVTLHGGAPVLPKAPQNFTANSVNTGGYFWEDSVYRYRVTAILPEGETAPSRRITVRIDDPGSNNAVRLRWDAVPRATGYHVYGRNMARAPKGLKAEALDAGGFMNPNKTYGYTVTAVLDDGETNAATVEIDMAEVATLTRDGTADKRVLVTWNSVPGATAYRIYGRRDNDPQSLLATSVDTDYWDTGENPPDWGNHPAVPFSEGLIAASVKGTTYLDTGEAAPGVQVKGEAQPATLTWTTSATDLEDSAQGRFERFESQTDLVHQATVEARAAWLLDRYATVRPYYTLTLDPTLFPASSVLWLGDMPRLFVQTGRLDVDASDLRITEMSFSIDDTGTESITATLGFRPRNIFQKVRKVASRLELLERR